MNALAWILKSDTLEWILTIGGALIAFGGLLLRDWFRLSKARRDTRRDLERETLRDMRERAREGRHEIQESRDNGLSPDDRVRRYDGAWND